LSGVYQTGVRSLVRAGALFDDGGDVESDELGGGCFPAVGEQGVDVFSAQFVDLGGGGEVVVAADFLGFRDGGVGAGSEGFDLSVGQVLDQK